jgi:putative ABC transport system substrate-binding protein
MKKTVFGTMLLAVLTILTSSHALFAGSKTLKIAMIQWRGDTESCQGFRDGLKELGYSVDYTYMNAKQDRIELGRLLREELEPKMNDFDYIYTFGTTVSKAAKTIVNNRVPQLFSSVAGPVEAEIVQSLEAPGGNISGSNNAVPIATQIETIMKIIQFKRLGLFFNPREQNAMIERQRLSDAAKRFNLEVIDLRSPPAQEMLEQNLQQLIDKSIVVDAVYLPLDSFMVSNAKLIGDKLRDARVKSIGSLEGYIKGGALIGVVPNYYQLGKSIASIVDKNQKGEKLQNIPVVTVKEPTLMINKTTADLLQIRIPEDTLKRAVVVE